MYEPGKSWLVVLIIAIISVLTQGCTAGAILPEVRDNCVCECKTVVKICEDGHE